MYQYWLPFWFSTGSNSIYVLCNLLPLRAGCPSFGTFYQMNNTRRTSCWSSADLNEIPIAFVCIQVEPCGNFEKIRPGLQTDDDLAAAYFVWEDISIKWLHFEPKIWVRSFTRNCVGGKKIPETSYLTPCLRYLQSTYEYWIAYLIQCVYSNKII